MNREILQHFIKKSALWSLFFFMVTLSLFCRNDSPTPTSGDNTCPVTIIAPSNVRTGEFLPVVVRVQGESAKKVTASYPVDCAEINGDNSAITVKKGVGSQSLQVNARNDFQLRFENLTGEKSLFLRDLKKSALDTF